MHHACTCTSLKWQPCMHHVHQPRPVLPQNGGSSRFRSAKKKPRVRVYLRPNGPWQKFEADRSSLCSYRHLSSTSGPWFSNPGFTAFVCLVCARVHCIRFVRVSAHTARQHMAEAVQAPEQIGMSRHATSIETSTRPLALVRVYCKLAGVQDCDLCSWPCHPPTAHAELHT